MKETMLFLTYDHTFKDNRVWKSILPFLNEFKIVYQYRGNKNKVYSYDGIDFIETKEKLSENMFFSNILVETKYDYLFLHNPDVSHLSVLADALKKRSKIIADFHEYIPESYFPVLEDVRFFGSDSIKTTEQLFEKFLKISDKIIVVGEMIKEKIIYKFSVPNEKILVYLNFAKSWLDSVIPFYQRKREIVIVGLTKRNMRREIPLIEQLSNFYKIKIIGVKEVPKELRLNNKIMYLPYMDYENMLREISNAMFSLISYLPPSVEEETNYRLSLPNKFFDSMAAGVPVIVSSNLAQIAKIVFDTGVGFVINPEDLSSSIRTILSYSEQKNYESILSNLETRRKDFLYTDDKKEKLKQFIISYKNRNSQL